MDELTKEFLADLDGPPSNDVNGKIVQLDVEGTAVVEQWRKNIVVTNNKGQQHSKRESYGETASRLLKIFGANAHLLKQIHSSSAKKPTG